MVSQSRQRILDIVKGCDNLPHDHSSDPAEATKSYIFKLNGFHDPLGYIPRSIVERIAWSKWWSLDHQERSITLFTPAAATTDARSKIVEETLLKNKELGTISLLQNWRNETFPVYGPEGQVLLNVERCASALFGIVTYGVQLICYANHEDGPRLWIAKRSEKKQTYAGMLDTTAAGGLGSGTMPIDGLISEAEEEASIPAETVRSKAESMGELTYFHIRGDKAGGESGLFQPEVEYTYTMELDQDFIPKPKDTEVECFRSFTVGEALNALKEGLFKPNSAIVIVQFLIKRGILTPENEPGYDEIISHLHRKLEFPIFIQPSL
ncbi:unnamed protein product [Penicillium bialowiezense]